MRIFRIFAIFCRLKRQEVWGWFWNGIKDNIILITIWVTGLSYFALVLYASTTNKILYTILKIPLGLAMLFFGFILVYCLISEIIRICKSNWQEAKKIVENSDET